MKNTVRLLKWLIKAFVFFTLFAFALNNQHDASLHLFFGHQWRSPMVLIILAAFAAGLFVGVLGMAPSRWRHKEPAPPASGTGSASSSSDMAPPSTTAHGL